MSILLKPQQTSPAFNENILTCASRDTRVCEDRLSALRNRRRLEDYVLVDFTVPLTTSE
jgi:hypothetical protein